MRLIAVLVLLMCAGPAMAATGNDLKQWCAHGGNDKHPETWACMGYIEGALELYWSLSQQGLTNAGFHCTPDNIPRVQLMAITKKHLDRNPEILHFNGANLVLEAMAKAFPCAKPAPGH